MIDELNTIAHTHTHTYSSLVLRRYCTSLSLEPTKVFIDRYTSHLLPTRHTYVEQYYLCTRISQLGTPHTAWSFTRGESSKWRS